MLKILLWAGYFLLFAYLVHKGKSRDAVVSGHVGFIVQSFAYVATYISAVALVGFGGLAHRYGMQMMLIAAGNVWFGAWMVYRFVAWPTREWQTRLQARTPAQMLGTGHGTPFLTKWLGAVFALFLGVYASAVVKGAALLLAQIVPLPVGMLVWIVCAIVGVAVFVGGLRGVLFTEAMQGMVMLCGILMIVCAVCSHVGGPWDGLVALSQLPPDKFANEGFTSLSSGDRGIFIISLVIVTSVAVWAQPQMIQRHFSIADPRQLMKSTALAMLILTVLVGGAYYAAAMSRLILPEVSGPDSVMPELVRMLMPEWAMNLFVLAIVSASLSTATAVFHISVASLTEDLTGKKASRFSWLLGIIFIVALSGSCAQIRGQLVALLCATSWSVVGSTALVPYLMLVLKGKRCKSAALASSLCGFFSCMSWYLFLNPGTAVIRLSDGFLASIPPFFVGVVVSWLAWKYCERRSQAN
ncbi:MAG: sodium:solute symporter family protein [Desulfovibrionaceae bacterium]|nr:sodium:solute symporter family protein [Desulfovibrionaceae bacterium]